MYKDKLIGKAFLFPATMCILVMGSIPVVVGGEDETEILNITVGQPTLLHPLTYQSYTSVSISRTGVVAAFYPLEGFTERPRTAGSHGAHRWLRLHSTAVAAPAEPCATAA